MVRDADRSGSRRYSIICSRLLRRKRKKCSQDKTDPAESASQRGRFGFPGYTSDLVSERAVPVTALAWPGAASMKFHSQCLHFHAAGQASTTKACTNAEAKEGCHALNACP